MLLGINCTCKAIEIDINHITHTINPEAWLLVLLLANTVDPQLSEPRLSELSLIRTPILGIIMIFIGILLCIK